MIYAGKLLSAVTVSCLMAGSWGVSSGSMWWGGLADHECRSERFPWSASKVSCRSCLEKGWDDWGGMSGCRANYWTAVRWGSDSRRLKKAIVKKSYNQVSPHLNEEYQSRVGVHPMTFVLMVKLQKKFSLEKIELFARVILTRKTL